VYIPVKAVKPLLLYAKFNRMKNPFTFLKITIPVILVCLLFGISQAQNSLPVNTEIDEQPCNCADPLKVFPDKALSTDTVFCYTWPFQANDWEKSSITLNTYDEAGHLTLSIAQTWDADQQMYVPSTRKAYEYTANGQVELDTYEFWNPQMNGGSWDPLNKKLHEYDTDGRLVFTFTWFSTYEDPEWRDGSKEFYTYNMYDLKDTVIYQYWNTIQNDWYYSYRYRYVYDEDQQLLESYTDWANNLEGTYVLNTRTIYIQDTEENTLDQIDQYYNLNTWVNEDHAFTELNADGQPLSVLYQNWDPFNNVWDTVVMQRDIFAYNEDGLLQQYRTQSFYIMWMDTYRTLYQYYEDGSLKETLTQEWQSFYEQWQNSSKCVYPQPENTTTGIDPVFENELLSLYPNPAHEQVILSAQEAISNVSVYNTIGQEVYVATPGTNEFTLKTAAWDEGLYFITVKGKDHSITKKLIIRH